MTQTPDFLAMRCTDIVEGSGAAIEWVADTRRSSQRLDRDADGLIERLRRNRNLCRRLGAAAKRPMSIGFFGLSQAGKSYLISALVRGENGALETSMDGKRLNFISHINPPGGGKEATALVTRFTRNHQTTPNGYPVALKLFAEADLVKILGNSFFSDFDPECFRPNSDPHHIRQLLSGLEKRRLPQATGGMTEDDVVDIIDYFVKRYPGTMEPLMGDYAPSAIALAPYLAQPDRATLFSVLWGELGMFTDIYLHLRGGLDAVSHAGLVYAPLSVLVQEVNGALSQSDSIMNVAVLLQRLTRDGHDRITVVPVNADGAAGGTAALPRSLLAALAMEMAFELAEAPRVPHFDGIDLIDFPGYRGRKKVRDIAKEQAACGDSDLVGELVLRGKVALLFERYTDDQEMNVLVLCTPSDKQSDVEEVSDVLTSWINSTQGATPEERARRRPGLFWAITMMDKRIGFKPGETLDLIRNSWPGMMDMALLERFKKCDWVHNWSPGHPFNNLFLVRKPGMAPAIFRMEGEVERGIQPDQQRRMDDHRSTFMEDPTVRKHVHDPAGAWDAMMSLDDGGMGHLAARLAEVAHVEVKLTRIGEQIEQVTRELVEAQLGGYYRADGADEVARKKKIVDLVLGGLKTRPTSFGEVLRALQPSADHLRSLYIRAEAAADEVPATSEAATAPAPADAGLISLDFFGGDTPAAPAPTASTAPATSGGRAGFFAKAVVSDWIKQLRQLPENAAMRRYLGLPGEVLQNLADELITGALRFKLEDKLIAALHRAEVHASTTRSRLADQQVRVASTIINDYVDYLGFSEVPPDARPKSLIPGATGVFAPRPKPPRGGLPVLTPNPLNYSGMYIVDWFEAFRACAIGNAGHAAGSEISPEQNDRLGTVLKKIAGATLSARPSAPVGA